MAGSEAKADGAHPGQDIVAFCRMHGDLDYPAKTFFGARYVPNMLPKQVDDLFPRTQRSR